jgi:hypothetical protein
MDIQTSIEYLKSLSGSTIYPSRSPEDQALTKNKISEIQESIPLKIPEQVIEFYSKFMMESPVWLDKDISQEIDSCLAFHRKEDGVKVLFNEFLKPEEILEQWENVGVEEQDYFGWNLLKIGFTPWQGGIYIGCDEQNNGVIYWVHQGFMREDFTLDTMTEGDSEGIKILSSNIYEFLDGLYISFPEEEEILF